MTFSKNEVCEKYQCLLCLFFTLCNDCIVMKIKHCKLICDTPCIRARIFSAQLLFYDR